MGANDGDSKDTSGPSTIEDHWARCANEVKDHNDAVIKRWKDEIDTLLVYAGLFSAVLTGFNVEAYQRLRPDPADTSNELLMRISMQLNSLSANAALIDSSRQFSGEPPPPIPASIIWINALWFASLICSLSAAFIAMSVKQWLHEAEIGLSGLSREVARLRQYRHDGLLKWHVGTIVAALPLLLQLATVLFFAGLLILLYTLHRSIAVASTALIGILVLFTAFTTIVPAFSEDCCYRSPLSTGAFLLVQFVGRCVSGGSSYFSFWGRYHGWAGMERAIVMKSPELFDEHIVETANALVLSDEFTNDVVRPCVKDLPLENALGSSRKILSDRAESLGTRYVMVKTTAVVFTAGVQVSLILDAIEKCMDGIGDQSPRTLQDGNTMAPKLRSLLEDLEDLEFHWATGAVSERLLATLACILRCSDGRGNIFLSTIRLLLILIQTCWDTRQVVPATMSLMYGSATQTVIQALEATPLGLDPADPTQSALYDASDHFIPLVVALATCALQPDRTVENASTFVLEHLRSALASLEGYLEDHNLKIDTTSRLVDTLSPVLRTIHRMLPEYVTAQLVIRLHDAESRWILPARSSDEMDNTASANPFCVRKVWFRNHRQAELPPRAANADLQSLFEWASTQPGPSAGA